jgi:hypothetical protein
LWCKIFKVESPVTGAAQEFLTTSKKQEL